MMSLLLPIAVLYAIPALGMFIAARREGETWTASFLAALLWPFVLLYLYGHRDT